MNEKKLLRRAAYWLGDYANCLKPPYINAAHAEEVKRMHDKLRKLAAQCRKAGRA